MRLLLGIFLYRLCTTKLDLRGACLVFQLHARPQKGSQPVNSGYMLENENFGIGKIFLFYSINNPIQIMKYFKFSLLTVCLTLFMWSCGGNKDADKFCDCYKQFESGEKNACEEEMEALEEAFKKDDKRFEAFQKAAMKKCPEASKYINRMN
jgi:hypothetical protein